MNKILWTNQRTGSCTYQRNNGGGTEYFVEDGPHHDLNLSLKDLDNRVKITLNEGKPFKVIVENVKYPLLLKLLEHSKDYEHVILYRQNSPDRLLSYHLAMTTGAFNRKKLNRLSLEELDLFIESKLPVDDLVRHELRCRKLLRLVRSKLHNPTIVAYEDVFDPSKGYGTSEIYNQIGDIDILTDKLHEHN